MNFSLLSGIAMQLKKQMIIADGRNVLSQRKSRK